MPLRPFGNHCGFCSGYFSFSFGLNFCELLGSGSGLFFFREIVELFDEFVACEDSLFEIVGKFKRSLRTRCDTKLTERAAAKIVLILVELAFFLAVGGIDHLSCESDGAVGAIAFADTAGDALVVSVGVVLQLKDGAETFGHLYGFAVFGIFFGDLRGDKFFTGHLHAFYKAHDARP